jgi:hypothetical protein
MQRREGTQRMEVMQWRERARDREGECRDRSPQRAFRMRTHAVGDPIPLDVEVEVSSLDDAG